jgi:hypothetical protein
MVGGGPFNLQPGQWTDDTSMALCLGESLVQCHGFDPKDQMDRYVRWWRDGHLSCTGRCFDIGITVSAALSKYTETGYPFSGSVDPRTAGNGSLMRLAPVPLAYRENSERAIHYAGESSRTTHGVPAAVDACKFYTALILGALRGASKEYLLSHDFYQGSLVPEIAEIAAGSFKQKTPPVLARVMWSNRWKPRSGPSTAQARSKEARCSLLASVTMPIPPPPCLANWRALSMVQRQSLNPGWNGWPCANSSPKWRIVWARSPKANDGSRKEKWNRLKKKKWLTENLRQIRLRLYRFA